MRWQAHGTLLVVSQTGSVEDVLQTCLAVNECFADFAVRSSK